MDTAEENWSGSRPDLKNMGLVRMIYRLRQDLDVDRVIGLNVERLSEHGGSDRFWGYVQAVALDSIIITIYKIFERDTMGYERNSIPGIIDSIADTQPSEISAEVMAFCSRFNYDPFNQTTSEAVKGVLAKFKSDHAETFRKISFFRNKIAAHSEHRPKEKIDALPSHGEFEAIFVFADGAYRLFCELISNGTLCPAKLDSYAGRGLVRVMKKLGIKEPTLEFDDEN